MIFRILVLCFLFLSCKKEHKKPSYIYFKLKNDSIFVELRNKEISTTFLKIKNLVTKKETIIDFKKPDTLTILKFHQTNIDTVSILKNYTFLFSYGASSIKKYDTLYNYGLPFLKGKRYQVLQSQNGSFTHKGPVSKYAIDFKMNVGQEVCAIREGLVIHTKSNSDEGGASKKYRNKANMILVYHHDGTFAQYAHLKKNGVLVKKGDSIKKGQIIGYSGNTGMSTEPHLHFVVYKPTSNGLVSIRYILDSIPIKKYMKGKYANHN
ncbi:MAG: murein DD-endopeptidase MepM/ murein hydrolase activator NlpD [Polaribacter sp.]|jgi:murein DD-endopeptidase MepM/ murein hydrolase activator NlpD